MAGLSGLALGLGLLVSLDSVIYLLPVIPFAGLLIAARRAGGIAFVIGGVIGVGYGLADGYVLSRPFLDAEAHQLELIGVIAAWLAALTLAAVQLFRLPEARQRAARLATRRPVRWLPGLAGLIAAAALIGLLVRPYVQTVRSPSGVVNFRFIAALQQAQGLPVDPTRTYAEDSLYWVIWYIGLPALLLGVFGLAVLARRCVRALLTWRDPGPWRNWALPLLITGAGSAAVLWDPGILPDQPWASRRLVVVVLPGLIATAIWASARLSGHARERGARPVTAAVAGLFCVGRDGPAHRRHHARGHGVPLRPLRRPAPVRAGPGVPGHRHRPGRGRRPALRGTPAAFLGGDRRLHGGPGVHAGHPGHVRSADGVDDRPAAGRAGPGAGRHRRSRAPPRAARAAAAASSPGSAAGRTGCWTCPPPWTPSS